MCMKVKGIGASRGISMAKVYKIEALDLDFERVIDIEAEEEIDKLHKALEKSIEELEFIKKTAEKNLGSETAEVFNAHIQILKDPEMLKNIEEKIKDESFDVSSAVKTVFTNYITMFNNMSDDYMKERAADLKDLRNRLLSHLLGIKILDTSMINEEVIIVANDLTPSDTAQFNKSFVKGFTTNIGGRTSHSAIMARSLEIPAVVGTNNILDQVNDGDLLIIDGVAGEVIINPDEETVSEYEGKMIKFEEMKEMLKNYKGKPSITKDGHVVELVANIGSPNDIDGVLENDGEGIGLYRTEFIYMESADYPTEEEQYEAYKIVLEKMDGKPTVIRTLDIGGDKELDYLDLPEEMNPFLGYRAIRLCLDRVDLFKTQLRALLRASVHGDLRIMFPMIATIQEFIDAKNVLNETKEELIEEGYAISDSYEVGMMVEVPAAAILADRFAKYVDFFSIGTNDLIQYTFAADRMSETVSYLYQPYNPSLLRLIKTVIDAAHKEGKWVGMCGEMAGDSIAVPILLGLGLDEFSMSATSILSTRHLLSKISKDKAEILAKKALDMDHNEEVYHLIKGYTNSL
ncbi:MAG TPA: phosphoenolpyruvate--protein phosphotransferase [Clostridia bacterium]|nr:phosphoenolpyruvate--protein phosphotransferase [Clostridia bacterium]